MDDLETYKAQLEQVQAALTTDPDNEDLLKLQKDLEEVINLTLELAVVSRKPKSTISSLSFLTIFRISPFSNLFSRDLATL